MVIGVVLVGVLVVEWIGVVVFVGVGWDVGVVFVVVFLVGWEMVVFVVFVGWEFVF